jgi:hypothetical protein
MGNKNPCLHRMVQMVTIQVEVAVRDHATTAHEVRKLNQECLTGQCRTEGETP